VALPFPLLIPRTRLLAVFAGGTFHVPLAVVGHVSFSGFAIAFYALFLPDDLPARLRRLRASRPRLREATDRVAAFARRSAAFTPLGGAWVLAAVAASYGPDRVLSALRFGVLLLMLVYAAVLAVVLLSALAGDRPPAYRSGAFRLAHPGWALGPLLAVLLACSPYLGLRTQDAFTITATCRPRPDNGIMRSCPRACRSSRCRTTRADPRLQRPVAGACRTRLVWWDFRRHASDHPDASVTYERRGSRREVVRIGDDATLSRAPNALLEKVLMFRDIPPADANTCCRTRSSYDYRNGS